MPESAPAAHAPADPMLHNKSVNAIGLSVAMKESTERFRSSASRCSTLLGFGNANAACRARLLTSRKEPKEYMIGYATVEMRVELMEGMSEEQQVEWRRSMAILYQQSPFPEGLDVSSGLQFRS